MKIAASIPEQLRRLVGSGRRRDAEAGLRRPGRAVGKAVEILFPPSCVGCGRSLPPGRPPVCSLCWSRLPPLAPPRCRRCGATRLLDLPAPGVCPECEEWPAELGRAAAPYRMEGGTVRLVHALKYEGWFALGERMGKGMRAAARRLGDGPHVLVPVPLSPARRRARGFNQAALLAAGLSAALGWPRAGLLRRDRTGRRQATLGRRARGENVRALFRVETVAPYPDLPVLLVDDVLTTGSTAAACARALAAAGRAPAGVVTFARALQQIERP